jgi:hypothetical protein
MLRYYGSARADVGTQKLARFVPCGATLAGIAAVLTVPLHEPTALLTAASGVDVVTYHNDIARTGQNLNETTLTPLNVNATTFGKVGFFQVDGKVDAQPLLLSGVAIPGEGARDVLYIATEHDTVYALDALSGAVFWSRSMLGPGETPSDARGCGQVVPEIGITATPVIDRTAGPNGVIYLVAMSKSGTDFVQRLHALDVTTGAELFGGPTAVTATSFDPKQYEERSALLLLNGKVILSWTSHCDIDPYNGWIMAYDASSLAQTSVLNTTPNGSRGAYWMAGAGPAADASGNVYLLAGNGTFDITLNGGGFPSLGDFGNAFLKVSTSSGLAVSDYFATFDTVSKSDSDIDLGSGGTLVLPDLLDASNQVQHLAVGAGKDGHIYVVNRDSMGKFNRLTNNIHQDLVGALPGGVWSMPAYFNGNLYYGPVGNPLKAFSIVNAHIVSTPSSVTATSFAYPGTTPGVSASGATNAIVWVVENSNPAVLHAYDATNLASELYNSNQAAGNRDTFGPGNKFITPTIANGRVYVGTTNGVVAFGLLTAPPTATTGIASVISRAGATLNGTANPNGTATTARFDYGLTTGYGSSTPGQALGAGSTDVAIGGGTLTGLVCGTLYHFRAAAANAVGASNGLDASFTTAPCSPPTVMTGVAGPIHSTGANISGAVNPNGAATTVTVEYGLSTSYGHVSLPLNLAAGVGPVPVSRLINDLTCHTVYHYRVVAANVSVTVDGSDATVMSDVCGFATRTLIWRNQVTGQNTAWLMNGTTVQATGFLPTVSDPQWTIQATGDIDGDRQLDLVWRHNATGQIVIWFLNGPALGEGLSLATVVDRNWVIRGLRDFNGDGKADLLWHNTVTGQNAVWFLNGTGLVSASFLPTVADSNWDVAGVADFNGDGMADLLWHNSLTGENVVWLMNGSTLANWAFLPQVNDPSWIIAAVDDLDGDGDADIVWRNTTSGANVAWFMSGTSMVGWGWLPSVFDLNVTLARVADIDGDGAADLVWRNRITGDATLWQMNGLSVQSVVLLEQGIDQDWQIIVR